MEKTKIYPKKTKRFALAFNIQINKGYIFYKSYQFGKYKTEFSDFFIDSEKNKKNL